MVLIPDPVSDKDLDDALAKIVKEDGPLDIAGPGEKIPRGNPNITGKTWRRLRSIGITVSPERVRRSLMRLAENGRIQILSKSDRDTARTIIIWAGSNDLLPPAPGYSHRPLFVTWYKGVQIEVRPASKQIISEVTIALDKLGNSGQAGGWHEGSIARVLDNGNTWTSPSRVKVVVSWLGKMQTEAGLPVIELDSKPGSRKFRANRPGDIRIQLSIAVSYYNHQKKKALLTKRSARK